MKIDKKLNEKIDLFIELYRDKIVQDICKLVEIKSVAEYGSDTLPFGAGCRNVLDKALEISKDMGFEIDNCDYHVGSASLKHNDSGPHIGIWGHLDVVPEGDGWNYPPYSPTLYEGYIIGRGASDNKGPSICALYTLLFFKKHDYNLKYNYKVFFGTNEESGMDDVEYFMKNRELPSFSIIADSVFPICYAEKGIFSGEIEIPIFSEDVIDVFGGVVRNAVANSAEIKLKKSCGVNFPEVSQGITIDLNSEEIRIYAKGKAAHAASPEGSINAIHLLATYLVNSTQSESMKKPFSFISDITASFDGREFGIKYSDDVSGELTCVVGVMNYKDNKICISLDIRYPITTDTEEMINKIQSYCENFGAKLTNINDSKPIYVDPNDERVIVLNNLYNEFMETDIPPYYEGGGSYARKIPNSLAFGPILHKKNPKPPNIANGGAHKADESLCIDEILLGLKIYILTVIKLDSMDIETLMTTGSFDASFKQV